MTSMTRHGITALASAGLVAVFWASRPQWDPEMRLWKAVGDASLILLIATLALGPAARLWTAAKRVLPWRREVGIWFALMAAAHTILILNGWARWSLSRFLGYEFVAQLGREARMEPGFGLANLVGLVALIWALILMATSTDFAVRRLGPASWKWLHNSAGVIFYLVLLHVGYFLFLHYTQSFHRNVPDPDWFRLPFLLLGMGIIGLRAAAFLHLVRHRRSGAERSAGARRASPRQAPAQGG